MIDEAIANLESQLAALEKSIAARKVAILQEAVRVALISLRAARRPDMLSSITDIHEPTINLLEKALGATIEETD